MPLQSPGVTYLECQIEPGVFPEERLVRFDDYAGIEQTALVSAYMTHADSPSSSSRVVVARKKEGGDRVLVALPTPDGDRVWVHRALLADG